jgi:hypothetical protein
MNTARVDVTLSPDALIMVQGREQTTLITLCVCVCVCFCVSSLRIAPRDVAADWFGAWPCQQL